MRTGIKNLRTTRVYTGLANRYDGILVDFASNFCSTDILQNSQHCGNAENIQAWIASPNTYENTHRRNYLKMDKFNFNDRGTVGSKFLSTTRLDHTL